jgi:hypothetical protein
MEDEVDGEGTGLRIGIHQGVTALIESRGVIRVGEPQPNPGIGMEIAITQQSAGTEMDAHEVLGQPIPAANGDDVLLSPKSAQHSPLESLAHSSPFRSLR